MKHFTKLFSIFALGLGGLCLYKHRQYPLAKPYRALTHFTLPTFFLHPHLIQLANKQLKKLPSIQIPSDMRRRTTTIQTKDLSQVQLTIYEPADANSHTPLPCLIYYHGGGFVFEAAPYLHHHALEYARTAYCKVIVVHYRTASCYPFPTPFQDCYDALQYTWDQSNRLGIDRHKIAVGGDSAGGALAAAVSLKARDEGIISLCFQMLIYPVTDARMQTSSMKRYTNTPMWHARLNEKMWRLYLQEGTFGQLPYASPMLAPSLSQLPNAYVEVAAFDCLRDEGIHYAMALQEAGSVVQLEDVKDTCHGAS